MNKRNGEGERIAGEKEDAGSSVAFYVMAIVTIIVIMLPVMYLVGLGIGAISKLP